MGTPLTSAYLEFASKFSGGRSSMFGDGIPMGKLSCFSLIDEVAGLDVVAILST